MATTKKARKTGKKTTTKKASKKKASSKKPTSKKQAAVRDSMAAFMNALAASKKSAEAMEKALQAEAKRRGLDPAKYGFARLRSHVKFRQGKGQLASVMLPEPK